jgi:archaellum component FlaD/FlaE
MKVRTTIDYRDYHARLHPVTFEQLRVFKFHTKLSMNDLINLLLKEALENNHIKQKVMDMYEPGVSQYMIRDWRENL